MTGRRALAAVIVLDAVAAGLALLVATRPWQSARLARPRPLADDLIDVSGRTIDTAPTACALVAVAGALALLATRGLGRRAVGAVLVLTGLVLAWRSVGARGALSDQRLRALDAAAHSGVLIDPRSVPIVTLHPQWAWASMVCGLLISLAGGAAVAFGPRWQVMSARYEAPTGQPDAGESPRSEAEGGSSTGLWTRLDAGDDPTA